MVAVGTKKRALFLELKQLPLKRKMCPFKENRDSMDGVLGTSGNSSIVYTLAMSYQPQTERASDNPPSTDAQTSILF